LLLPAGYVSTGTARILNSLRMLVALHKVRPTDIRSQHDTSGSMFSLSCWQLETKLNMMCTGCYPVPGTPTLHFSAAAPRFAILSTSPAA
jgi:hypothetical protein